MNLGNVSIDQGDYPAARALHEECLAITRELGDRGGTARSLGNLGNVAFEQGDYPAARVLHEECLAIMRELGDRGGMARSLSSLGNVAYGQGDLASARALHEEGLAIRRGLGANGEIDDSLEGLASVFSALGNPLIAARIWGAAERLREDIGTPLPPKDRPRHYRRVSASRASLESSAAFDRAWQEGRALTLEQAIELALEKTVERP
jgi:tetratricopeptide (TPR) repeat protein